MVEQQYEVVWTEISGGEARDSFATGKTVKSLVRLTELICLRHKIRKRQKK
jgi:hypothetical protein